MLNESGSQIKKFENQCLKEFAVELVNYVKPLLANEIKETCQNYISKLNLNFQQNLEQKNNLDQFSVIQNEKPQSKSFTNLLKNTDSRDLDSNDKNEDEFVKKNQWQD